jgi:hypothetical protein
MARKIEQLLEEAMQHVSPHRGYQLSLLLQQRELSDDELIKGRNETFEGLRTIQQVLGSAKTELRLGNADKALKILDGEVASR